MAAFPIVTQHNADYVIVIETNDGLFLAKAQLDSRLQAFGRTRGEALAKLRARIATAEDRAA